MERFFRMEYLESMCLPFPRAMNEIMKTHLTKLFIAIITPQRSSLLKPSIPISKVQACLIATLDTHVWIDGIVLCLVTVHGIFLQHLDVAVRHFVLDE